MKQITFISAIAAFFLFISFSCNTAVNNKQETDNNKGGLFIIGGGPRSEALMRSLIELSGVNKSGYAIILPMASEIPDTVSSEYIAEFKNLGVNAVHAFNMQHETDATAHKVDSLKNARLIYMTGGDQNLLMAKLTSEYRNAILHAYKNGATIAGTSAGAAVMSELMITGNQLQYDTTAGFHSIESKNIELGKGLGLVNQFVIDQHFIKRQRLNRLISVIIENPNVQGLGIDESTAAYIKNDTLSVYGENQVVCIKSNPSFSVLNNRLGAKDVNVSIYLPGEYFLIPNTK